MEKTPEEYVAKMVEVFREVRRVLRSDGTLWLNLGDSYVANCSNQNPQTKQHLGSGLAGPNRNGKTGLKPKDLCMIPARVALALQADGWWLRSKITWCKRAPMPESVTDRPTSATEEIFLFSKSERYFFDNAAVKEEAVADHPSGNGYARPHRLSYAGRGQAQGWVPHPDRETEGGQSKHGNVLETVAPRGRRNMRNYWILGPEPFKGAHFACFPTEIPRRAILAGTSARGCCPKCGAPWERVVENKSLSPVDYNGKNTSLDPQGSARRMAANLRAARLAGADHDHPFPPKKTLGWKSTCECFLSPDNVQTVPCTVLDPFAGSGTTGQVALELGRKAILIELNPEYVALAKQRCNVTPGLPL